MAIIQGNAKQGSVRGFYPKVINGSLRFNDDDSAYLSWTPASAGNRKTWTFSAWVKRGAITGGNQDLFAPNIADQTQIWILSGGAIRFYQQNTSVDLQTTPVFRDHSAWYHFVFEVDTTQATASNRIKIYVNGEQITAFDTANYPSQNTDMTWNTTNEHRIGGASLSYLDAYLANVHFIDGQALTASDFGETKNGVWVAKDYAGTFGTNGFYLTFEDDTQVEAFNTVLYRGNGGTQSITGTGFAPDLVWIKERTSTSGHVVFDQVRGATKSLFPDNTGAESTTTTQLTSFDSDGFTTGSSGGTNESGQNYVAWCWKAGDSNVSNTDGTITSTVRANDTYGFSIVSYTGTGVNGNWGHGLSAAPDMVIVKNRDNGGMPWLVYHSSNTANPETDYLLLNSTAATTDFNTAWNDTAPTSTVFNVGTADGTNQSGYKHIAYCWSETTGYSKFGSYTGTGSGGNAVTGLGFTPAWLMIKRTDSAQQWGIVDNTRKVTNPKDNALFAESSQAESTTIYNTIDFDSDGFTLNTGDQWSNASGGTYIYAAFADTREAAFWLDQSGNDNDWQPVNLDHNDTVADSPTNNFATLNPVGTYGGTLSDGNLTHTSAGQWVGAHSTIAMQSGKWYCEYTATDAVNFMVGIVAADGTNVPLLGTANSGYPGKTSDGYGWINNANKINNDVSTSYGSAPSNGDVIMIAFDADNGELYVGKNGTWFNSSNPSTNTSPMFSSIPMTSAYYFCVANEYANGTINFGQQPFKYDPPA